MLINYNFLGDRNMYAAWQLACVGLQSLEGARENQTATAPFIIHVS